MEIKLPLNSKTLATLVDFIPGKDSCPSFYTLLESVGIGNLNFGPS